MKYDIVSFGSATQDVFMSSTDFKEIASDQFETKKGLCAPLGSKIHMDKVFFGMGGIGANVAVTFASQDLKTAYVGMIGQDLSGQNVKDELTKHGVALDFLKETADYPTAYSVILSLPGVGRTILEMMGACHQITEADIPFDKIETDWFYIGSLSSNCSQVLEPVINYAAQNKIKIAFNPGRTQLNDQLELTRKILNKVDILFVNQEEAAKLTDLDYNNETEIFKKFDQMVEGIAVMTKGPQGVVVSDGQKIYSAGIPESDMIERTGAGDAFGSGFTSAIIQGQDISYAIQLGTANSTAVLQEYGATNGLLKKGQWGPWPKVNVEEKKL